MRSRATAVLTTIIAGGALIAWALFASEPSGYGEYPRVGMCSAMRGNGWPFLRANGSIDSAACEEQARWDVVILDVQAPKHRPEILATIRHYNPRIKLLGYVMGAVWWRNPYPALGDTLADFAWHYWCAVRGTDGILWCRGDRPCGFMNVNLAAPWTALALADTILQDVVWPGLWDGLFIDVSCPGMTGIISGPDTVDIGRLGFASVGAFETWWRAGHRAFVERIRSRSPAGFLIVGNCGPGGERDQFNGWTREDFPYQNGRYVPFAWVDNMIRSGWGAPGYLVDDTTYVEPTMNWLLSTPGYDSLGAETLRRNRLGLASATLGGGFHSFERREWEPRRFWWMPEYAVTPQGNATRDVRFKGWLGAPAGVARALASGVWQRDFARGVVLVNPTDHYVSVTPGGLCRTIQAPLPGYTGVWRRTLLVPPQDGLLLLRKQEWFPTSYSVAPQSLRRAQLFPPRAEARCPRAGGAARQSVASRRTGGTR